MVESLDAERVESDEGPMVEVRFRVPADRVHALLSEVATAEGDDPTTEDDD